MMTRSGVAPAVPREVQACTDAQLAAAVLRDGLCVGTLPGGPGMADPWHPTSRNGRELADGPGYVRRARMACLGCPVTAQCLEWTLRRESRPGAGAPYGIYGGLAPGERARLVARRRRAAARRRAAQRRGLS